MEKVKMESNKNFMEKVKIVRNVCLPDIFGCQSYEKGICTSKNKCCMRGIGLELKRKMTQVKEKETCEQKIAGELKGRMEDIDRALELADNNKEEAEGGLVELQKRVLAISKTIVYRIKLSSGGPQDYFEIVVDSKTKGVIGGTYHYLDWFDNAQRNLSNEELDKIERVYGPFDE